MIMTKMIMIQLIIVVLISQISLQTTSEDRNTEFDQIKYEIILISDVFRFQIFLLLVEKHSSKLIIYFVLMFPSQD